MVNPVNEFSIVTVSCFDVSVLRLRQGMGELFRARGMNVQFEMRRLDYEQYGPEPLRGAKGSAKAGIWGLQSSASYSFMISNLVDGWQTLATATSSHLSCRCWRFTVSAGGQRFPRNAFSLMEAGRDLREVQAQLDDPSWVFYEHGELLGVEDKSMYERRRIRDRVTREYVISVADRAGFPISSDAFWVTGDHSFSLNEVR